MFLLCNKRRKSAFPLSVRKYLENEFIVNRMMLQSSLKQLYILSNTLVQVKLNPNHSPSTLLLTLTGPRAPSAGMETSVCCEACYLLTSRGCGHARRGQIITRVLESKKCFTPATRFSVMAFDFMNAEISPG